MMGRTIDKGDFIIARFDGHSPIEGYVQSTPCDVGDMWYIKVMYPNGKRGIVAINPNSSKLLYIEKYQEE